MRYTKAQKPRADWFSDDPPCPDIRVDEHIAKDTGLIWTDGEKIMRQPNPLGFGRDAEW